MDLINVGTYFYVLCATMNICNHVENNVGAHWNLFIMKNSYTLQLSDIRIIKFIGVANTM